MERYVLKSNAKNQLKGRWLITIAALLVSGMISSVISSVLNFVSPVLGMIVAFCITGIVSFGVSVYSLNVVRGNASFTDIFDGFKSNVFLKAIGLGLIVTIATAAGFCLLVVPGIILTIMFSQSFFIFIDNPELSPIDCIKESAEMMKGHKLEYFVLKLSFLGWAILISVVAGIFIGVGVYMLSQASILLGILLPIAGVIIAIIMGLFLSAYISITYANYYTELKSINENNNLDV